jgi:hypothetical protein
MAIQKKEINLLITMQIDNARTLRTIAENRGFKDRKKFIEYLCQTEVDKFNKKQLKLKI